MSWTRVLIALFVAYVAATAVHVGYVIHHEPFAFDAWNVAVDTHAQPFSVSRFFEFWWDQYTHANPRLGQTFTYWSYKLEYFAAIATPIMFLGLTLGITVLGIGRWPARARDLALWAIAIGFSWFVLPQIGRNMFCRAYSANYVYTAALLVWFLVPLRLSPHGEARISRAIAYALAGVAVGMCNEHTGPTLIVFLLGYGLWLRRRGHAARLVLAGFVGVISGFAAIFFAPGQDQRYGELAQEISLPMRLIRRGIVNNLDIVRDYVMYAAPLLLLLVVVLLLARPTWGTDDEPRRRGALRIVALALGAGGLVTATLFVSPKLGSRFHVVSMAILLAGFVAVVDAVLASRRGLAPFVVLAIAASSYAAVRTVPLYTHVARHGAERIAALEASVPGTEVVAEALDQVDESWWYIGDDLDAFDKRELVAKYFGLARVLYRGQDLDRPLGMSGMQLVASYRVPGDAAVHLVPAFELGTARAFDVAGLQRATRSSFTRLYADLDRRLDSAEVAVVFAGTPPPLPRQTLLLARWHGAFEAYAAKLLRKGAARRRDVALPAGLAGKPYEIYVVRVGDPPKLLGGTDGQPLHYVPWRAGIYWVLACDADACFVIAATRQTG